MRRIVLALPLVAMLSAGLAKARPGEHWRERLQERMATRDGQSRAAAMPADLTVPYGNDPLQQTDVWRAKGSSGVSPLILFVHGGGWSKGDKGNATGRWKAAHFTGQGYVFASINYRLVPEATVEQQAGDVAQALKTLLDRSRELGIDKRRVVLMGHSAGAHLVALAGTDERYLRAAGLSFADVAGIVALDGAGYDIVGQFADAGPRLRNTYLSAFGGDPARQRELSPSNHVQGPNAGQFLILHVDRTASKGQSQDFASALSRSGTPARVQGIAGRELMGHLEINRRLGDPGYPATTLVDDWLKLVFAG